MSQQAVSIARQLSEEVWNQRRVDLADNLIGPNHINHDPNTPDLGRGPEGYKRLVALYTTAFPDLRFTLTDTVCEGDKIAMVWQVEGTHTGDLRGTPPTYKRVFIEGVTVSRHANGKLQESRVSWDALGMMQQLGIVPPLAQKAAGSR